LWGRNALAFGAEFDESGHVLAVLAIVLAVLVVYAQALGGALIWDDQFLIPGVPLVERGGTLDDYLKAPFWTGVNPEGALKTYYRPLVTLSLAFDHAVHGDNAAGYHLTNVVLHLACALLVYFLLRKGKVRPAVASLVTIWWALLPRLAEAAAWVSGRTDMLGALFALAALLAWGPGTGRRLLATGLLGLGLLGKESAAAAIAAILAVEWAGARGQPRSEKLRRVGVAFAPILVVLVVYAVLRFRAVGFVVTDRSLGFVGRLIAVLDATGTYGAMLLDPFRPRALIGTAGVPEISGVVAGVVLLVGGGVACVRTWGRLSPQVLLGLVLAFASIFPVLHVVPIPVRTLAADRFLYLPTAGLALALAPALDRLLASRRPAWLVASALTLALAVSCARRVALWSDEISFWIQTYLETPRSNNSAATNLASLYYRVGMYEDALTLYRRSVGYDDPHRRTARYNLALSLSRLGRNEEARAALLASAARGRPDSERQFHLSLIELRLGQTDAAVSRLKDAATSGHPGARWLLPRLDEIAKGQREIAAAGDDARPADRARLYGLLGADALAVEQWARAIADPRVGKHTAMEGLIALVQSGGPDALRAGVRTYTRRFGPIDAATLASIEVRLADLDRLVAARPVVGLSR
jgi:tetratricopeptide (TPR) repeat protein